MSAAWIAEIPTGPIIDEAVRGSKTPPEAPLMQIDLPFDAVADSPTEVGHPDGPPAAVLQRLQVVFVRHPRARRYVLRVDDQGAVRVTIPRGGSRREARAFAEREQAWIEKQLRRESLKGGAGQEPGEALGDRRARETNGRVRARRELPPRLLELAALHGLTVKKISIRNQQWRWGSCSPDGHICLNWRLVLLPDAVRDYVLIHELMHLKRLDHSPRFWKLVERACPDYRHLRRQLRASFRD